MQPDTTTLIIIYSSLIIALIMFPLTWIARNIWQNKTRTQLFALIGVTAMVIFLASVWDYLPD
jgi:glycopeptide antibiotics resistance protein